jgi:competence CoiA-like predicted nuclease
MAAGMTSRNGETDQHARLKRLAFLWAQAQGFSVCAMEVSLPKCRYRADVAAAAETDWNDCDLRMQTNALRFATRQLPH